LHKKLIGSGLFGSFSANSDRISWGKRQTRTVIIKTLEEQSGPSINFQTDHGKPKYNDFTGDFRNKSPHNCRNFGVFMALCEEGFCVASPGGWTERSLANHAGKNRFRFIIYLYLRNPNLMKISFCTINPKLVLFCGSVHQQMRDEVQHHLVQMYSYTC
jgi:hypothetical protein